MRACFLILLATTVLLVKSIQAESVTTVSRQTNVVSLGTIHLNNVIPTHDSNKRFLRTHKNDIAADEDDNYDADSEERGLHYKTVQEIAKKLGAKASKKWKILTDNDFRNYKLFMGKASFDELYKKGATPFKLSTQMGRENIDVTTTRYSAYFDYWVERNIQKQLGTSTR